MLLPRVGVEAGAVQGFGFSGTWGGVHPPDTGGNTAISSPFEG